MSMETIFIIGGCKSGKSSFALKLAEEYRKVRKIYVATSVVMDDEMKDRVEKHKKERGHGWETLECPYDLPRGLKSIQDKKSVVLVDCLTMWINNLLYRGEEKEEIERDIEELIKVIRENEGIFIFVSNEVGMGIVPADGVSRKYRDIVGILHQKVAQIADKVYFVTCGIPNLIKG